MAFERIQIISILASFFFLYFVVQLLRKKNLKEAYAILWLGFGMVFLFFSFWRKGLDYFAGLVGIYYPPAFLFLILITAIIMILMQFSVVLSKQNDQIRVLIQEQALLKDKLEKSDKM